MTTRDLYRLRTSRPTRSAAVGRASTSHDGISRRHDRGTITSERSPGRTTARRCRPRPPRARVSWPNRSGGGSTGWIRAPRSCCSPTTHISSARRSCTRANCRSTLWGYRLARMLGDEYVAIGVTSGAGTTATLEPDGTSEPYGFAVHNVPLGPPEAESIEAAFAETRAGLSPADLRRFRNEVPTDVAQPDRIRMDSAYIHTPVAEAFDLMVHVPASSMAEGLDL
ncbi:MAG: erythromycin esterase family protein [Gordonia amarae]|nr:erythromycin esterase family protein [Gordonia amarae]